MLAKVIQERIKIKIVNPGFFLTKLTIFPNIKTYYNTLDKIFVILYNFTYMSLDVGILIEGKKGKIYLFEVNLSTGKKSLVKVFDNSDEALSYLEKNNIGYESFMIKGFTKNKT